MNILQADLPVAMLGFVSYTPHEASPEGYGPCQAVHATTRPTSRTLLPCSTLAETGGAAVACSCLTSAP